MSVDQPLAANRSPTPLVLRLVAVAAMLAIALVAARGYYAQYYLVAAKRGEKSLEEYDRLLTRGVQHDPTNGRVQMELAALYASQKKPDEAVALQQRAMRSYNTLSAIEQRGYVQEKLAETTTGTDREQHRKAASELYESARRIQPGNITALEHLLLQAYREGDDARLHDLARELTHAQPGNVNAIYIRGLAAERAGNLQAAYGLYQQLITSREIPKGALFDRATIEKRVRETQSGIKTQ